MTDDEAKNAEEFFKTAAECTFLFRVNFTELENIANLNNRLASPLTDEDIREITGQAILWMLANPAPVEKVKTSKRWIGESGVTFIPAEELAQKQTGRAIDLPISDGVTP